MRKNYIILAVIFFIGAFLRFNYIERIPPSLTWDEAAWGYNAYALGIDGRDEFGRFLPHDYLESFGDFKPPLYAYLDILPIKIFGLNEFATRFPSAFLGTISVFLTYFLVRTVFFTSKKANVYGLFAAFSLAVSPWHTMLSRAAFEANVATFFIIAAMLCFLLSLQRHRFFIIYSAIFFALAFYTFNSARAFVPLLVIALTIGFWRYLLNNSKALLAVIFVGGVLMLPLISFLLSPQANIRFREVNIFSDPHIVLTANQEIKNDNNAWYSKIIHNRRLLYSVEYLHHYFDNLTPAFLFIKGDGNPKFSAQDVGELYLWELPFFIFGILLLFRKREGYWFIIPVWLLLGIIPAATARETPHALRIETVIPTFQILVAYGISQFYFFLKNTNMSIYFKRGIIGIVGILIALNIFYYLHGYYLHYPTEYSGEWQYGYKESIYFVREVYDQFDQVKITSELGRPYIYYLYYLKFDPEKFRQKAKIKRDVFGFVNVTSFDKYYFGKTLPEIPTIGKRVLFIDMPSNIPKGANILKIFHLLNGDPSLVAFTI